MWVFMLAFAGFPFTGGLVGKFYVFSAAYEAGWWWLIVIGVIATAVSIYYYLAVVKAMYMRPTGDNGNALYDGNKAWRIHFGPGKLPPVGAFWSLTMYERGADGQSFFTQNPLNRYAIGDRTKGLRYNADGSLDIYLQHESPGPDAESNWLPAPAGAFGVRNDTTCENALVVTPSVA